MEVGQGGEEVEVDVEGLICLIWWVVEEEEEWALGQVLVCLFLHLEDLVVECTFQIWVDKEWEGKEEKEDLKYSKRATHLTQTL